MLFSLDEVETNKRRIQKTQLKQLGNGDNESYPFLKI